MSAKEQLAEQLGKPVTKKGIEQKTMQDLNTIFWQQNYLRWYHCVLAKAMLNMFYIKLMLLLYMHGLNL